ncbi:MAG: aldehyde dehydrogenase family protein [Planctomycetes bacterium]|nr:aldehyde dehydrogenase family protein [Planctomycetota bacterium]
MTTTQSTNTIQNLNPSTGELLAELPCATSEEVRDAVARARAAQPAWEALGMEERCRMLSGIADGLAERADELARLATQEMGKLYEDAKREVQGFTSMVKTELEEVQEALATQTFKTKGNETQLVRMPHGVVAAITPWNFPVGMPLQILGPALAAGNTVVFKPSEHVPLTGQAIAEIVQACVPEDVLVLVHGAGETGAELVAADIDMVGFVGSRETGKRIMESASKELKRLVLELGGKDPLVVFADSDLDAAAECAVRHSLRNTGQVCCAVERVYVEESAATEFEEKVAALAADWRHGDGFEEGSKMGPLVSEEQRAKVVTQVDAAISDGARLVMGGSCPDGPGWYYPATVLADVAADQRITHEETFGPVVSLSTFDGSEEEAVRLANDTPYGLGANVYSGDTERGARVAARMQAGQVGINQYLGGAPGTPWVGARQSGFGFLGGMEGHRQFTWPKSISKSV